MSKWTLCLATGMAVASGFVQGAEALTMPQKPLYLADTQGVPGAVVFAPMAGGESFLHGGAYSSDAVFTGYFDPGKCYLYHFEERESGRHFHPARRAEDRYCGGDGEWSGNFLNWVTATPADHYRQTLTGGNRVRDEDDEIWLQPALATNNTVAHQRTIRGTQVVQGAAPFKTELGYPVSELTVLASGAGPSIIVTPGVSGSEAERPVQDFNPEEYPYADGQNEADQYSYRISARVKVCDASIGLEDNCVTGNGSSEPEGLIQRHAGFLGYSAVVAGESGTEPVAQGLDRVIDYLNEADWHTGSGAFGELQALALRLFQNTGGNDDPVQYRCQANAVVVFGGARLAESPVVQHPDPAVVGRIEDVRPYIEGEQPVTVYRIDGQGNIGERLAGAFKHLLANNEASESGLTSGSTTTAPDSALFGASFNPSHWTGSLKATDASEVGYEPNQASVHLWQAGEVLDSRDLQANPRALYTYNGDTGNGVAFAPASISGFSNRMRDDLNQGDFTAAERVRYFQGHAVAGLRQRESLLGDMVHSRPVYVQSPSLPWPGNGPFAGYSKFRSQYDSRQAMVYVGANDGMLHGFSADTGEELFAYIPEFLASSADDRGLHYLTNPGYQHRYYVDLTPVVSDVHTRGASDGFKRWRTVLVGGARTGAKGIFALDVTEPKIFADVAADLPMWEFSSTDDARMGYQLEPPKIGLADWGKGEKRWAVFLPNGYGAESPATGLFMLDIEGGLSGTWQEGVNYRFIAFETGEGATGLSPIRQVDLDGDSIIDRVYAGDLEGNLWVAAQNGQKAWANAYKKPLLTARIDGVAQPITSPPAVIRYPERHTMVLFGTGKYLHQGDIADSTVQSFYGIFDKRAGITRSDLARRDLTRRSLSIDGNTQKVRTSNGDSFDAAKYAGWYVDLPAPGERIVQAPQVRGRTVFVNTQTPSADPCDNGGESWLMAFGLDGTTPDQPVWAKLEDSFVGIQVRGGKVSEASIIGSDAFMPRWDGKLWKERVETGRAQGQLGRQSWQELYE